MSSNYPPPDQPGWGGQQQPGSSPSYGGGGYGEGGYGGGYGGGGGATPPSSNLVWGILTTLFCCLPFGIVSIVQAAKVDSLWASGKHAEAVAASESAKKWAIIAAVSGVVVLVLYGIFVVAVGASLEEPTF